MSNVLTCTLAVLADYDGAPRAEIYYSAAADRLVIRPVSSTVGIGIMPHTVGLKWDGSKYVADPEVVLDGTFVATSRPEPASAKSESVVLVFVGSMQITDIYSFLRGTISWLPVSQQALIGRNYGRDVVEIATVNSLTAVALMSATAPVLGENHAPIEAVSRLVYPFT